MAHRDLAGTLARAAPPTCLAEVNTKDTHRGGALRGLVGHNALRLLRRGRGEEEVHKLQEVEGSGGGARKHGEGPIVSALLKFSRASPPRCVRAVECVSEDPVPGRCSSRVAVTMHAPRRGPRERGELPPSS